MRPVPRAELWHLRVLEPQQADGRLVQN